MPSYYDDHVNYYRYFDTPEGCDIEKKTMVTARYGVMTGFVLATFDALMYSHAVGLNGILRRYAFHCLPLGAIGVTFSLVTNGLIRLREENDRINYFLGGFACGPIVATYLRSGHAVLIGGLALGVAGILKKDAVDEGWVFFPKVHSNMVTFHKQDYTLTKDPIAEMINYCPKKKDDKEC